MDEAQRRALQARVNAYLAELRARNADDTSDLPATAPAIQSMRQWPRLFMLFGVGFFCWSSVSTGAVDWPTPAGIARAAEWPIMQSWYIAWCLFMASVSFAAGSATLARVGIVVGGPPVRRRFAPLRRWCRRHLPNIPPLFK